MSYSTAIGFERDIVHAVENDLAARGGAESKRHGGAEMDDALKMRRVKRTADQRGKPFGGDFLPIVAEGDAKFSVLKMDGACDRDFVGEKFSKQLGVNRFT